MTKILFDIGNSSINWAIEDNGSFLAKGSFKYVKACLRQQLEQNIQLTEKEPPTDILVSNVARDDIITKVQAWINARWQLELWQAFVGGNFGKLENGYHNRRQLGIDRWLAMIAAWDKYKTGLCIVDCGTALTIDIIAHSGKHLGGYILPGIEMMQQTLIEKTEKITGSANKECSIELGNDTQTAIGHGATLAHVATIGHIVTRLDDETKCLLTGGMAKFIQPLLQRPLIYESNLVLRGLSILHKKVNQ